MKGVPAGSERRRSATFRLDLRPWYSHETDFGFPPSGTRPWDRGDGDVHRAHPRTPATSDTDRCRLQLPPCPQQSSESLSCHLPYQKQRRVKGILLRLTVLLSWCVQSLA